MDNVDKERLSQVISAIELFDAGEKILPDFVKILTTLRQDYLSKRAVEKLQSTLDDEYMPSHLFEGTPSRDRLTREVQEYFESHAVTDCIKHGARPFTVADYVDLARSCCVCGGCLGIGLLALLRASHSCLRSQLS